MFPPERTDNVEELIEALWQSLRRAADHWGSDVIIRPLLEGERYYVALKFDQAPDMVMRKLIRAYTRQYVSASGWQLSRLKMSPGHVEFELSVFCSRSQNRRENASGSSDEAT